MVNIKTRLDEIENLQFKLLFDLMREVEEGYVSVYINVNCYNDENFYKSVEKITINDEEMYCYGEEVAEDCKYKELAEALLGRLNMCDAIIESLRNSLLLELDNGSTKITKLEDMDR